MNDGIALKRSKYLDIKIKKLNSNTVDEPWDIRMYCNFV